MKSYISFPILNIPIKLTFIFIFVCQALFSQTKSNKIISKEKLQGTWIAAENNLNLKFEFKGDNFLIFKSDSLIFECRNFELNKKTLDTNCPGKEKLIFKIKAMTDSTLYMKSMSTDYYHKYVKIAKK